MLAHEWVTGVAQDTELQTRSDMRRRTIGRASLYTNSPQHKRATVPPRAGAASSAAAAAAVAVTPAKQQRLQTVGPNDATPPAAPVVAERPKTQEELVQELEGWKKLALKLMAERDATGRK